MPVIPTGAQSLTCQRGVSRLALQRSAAHSHPSLRRSRNVPKWAAAAEGPNGSSDDTSAGGSGSGGGSNEQEAEAELSLREQARLLNDLFYASPASDADAEGHTQAPANQPGPEEQPLAPPPARLLPDLPLWRVQWAALPGHQEVLIVHVPHYTSMFEQLLRQPRPWRYGHVYLPDGSRNLGRPEYELAPGTKAPLAGTLMEVLQACRMGDGRLVILAVGVCRLRVARQRQATPYSRADCELLVDAEEVQRMQALAQQALESVQGGLDQSGSSSGGGGAGLGKPPLIHAVPEAAQEAAAAYGQSWLEYELSDVRPQDEAAAAVIDGTRAGDAQVLGRRLAAIAGNEVLPLPFFDAVTNGVRADALAEALGTSPAAAEPTDMAGVGASSDRDVGSSDAAAGRGRALQAALDAQRPVLRQVEADAYAAATTAAADSISRHLQRSHSGSSRSTEGGASADAAGAADALYGFIPPTALNVVGERGVEAQTAEEELDDDDCFAGEPDSLALAVQLEAAVWREIDAVQALAGKLRNRSSALPEGLQSLRPPPHPAGAAAGEPTAAAGEQGGTAAADASAAAGTEQGRRREQPVAPPDYPALRRTQRLSFACAAVLANVSTTEGRQAWVEAGSVCARLRLGLAALRKHRQVLAAVVAVEGL